MLATLAEDLRSAGSATALVLGVGIGAYLGVRAGVRLYRDAEADARRVERRRAERARRQADDDDDPPPVT
jgi:hypothetical protein